MTIKPVDMQVNVPKATEASRVRSNDQNKTDANAQQQVASEQKRANDSLQRVSTKEDVKQKKINDDREKNKGKGNNKREKEEDNKTDIKNQNKFEKKNVIDISV